MTVFYSKQYDGGFTHSFIRYLGNAILEDFDVAYWVVPGTIDQMEDW